MRSRLEGLQAFILGGVLTFNHNSYVRVMYNHKKDFTILIIKDLKMWFGGFVIMRQSEYVM